MTLDIKAVEQIIETALIEDVGSGDLTSELVVKEGIQGSFLFVAREKIVVCGIVVLEKIFCDLTCSAHCQDGDFIDPGERIFSIAGDAREILRKERVALNLLQRMCGISTLTRKYVDAVKDTNAIILDTRKTTPCLRAIEKYAVTVGGGKNHRMRLDDGILIKDNHIHIAGSINQAVISAKEGENQNKTIEVECDTVGQVHEAVSAGADMLLLDNMSPDDLHQIVAEFGGKIPLEASGGVTLESIEEIAQTGVDYISVGALTHSAPSVDIGLDEDKN